MRRLQKATPPADIDAIHAQLMEFTANGGGDGPESVNQALHEAVTNIAWSDDRAVLKIVFLVGDAPPHMDYEQDVRYPEVCQAAMKRDLVINAVQCGQEDETAKRASTSRWCKRAGWCGSRRPRTTRSPP